MGYSTHQRMPVFTLVLHTVLRPNGDVGNAGWDSSVGIAIRCGLDGWGARFSAPIQTGPGAHPASYTMGTWSFPEVKRLGRGVDHPPLFGAEVKERVALYLYSCSGPSWPVLV
jgi:hypothetical protein